MLRRLLRWRGPFFLALWYQKMTDARCANGMPSSKFPGFIEFVMTPRTIRVQWDGRCVSIVGGANLVRHAGRLLISQASFPARPSRPKLSCGVYRALCFLADPRAHPLLDDDDEDTDARCDIVNKMRLGAFMDMSSSDVLLLVATVAGSIVTTRWNAACRSVNTVYQYAGGRAGARPARAQLRAERVQAVCDKSTDVVRALAQSLAAPLVAACVEQYEPLGLLRLCVRAKLLEYDAVPAAARARLHTPLPQKEGDACVPEPTLLPGERVVAMSVIDALVVHSDLGWDEGVKVNGVVYVSRSVMDAWLLAHADVIVAGVVRVLAPRIRRVIDGMVEMNFDAEYLPLQLGKECGTRILEWLRVHVAVVGPPVDWDGRIDRAIEFAVNKFGIDATNMHKVIKMMHGRTTCIVQLPKNHCCVCPKLHSRGDLYLMASETGENVRVSLRTWASGTHKEPYLGMIVVPAQGDPVFYPVSTQRVQGKRKW